MPRVLGVDLGSARVGLAVSDPEGITAQPLEVLRGDTTEGFVRAIAERATELGVEEIVVGLPIRMDGTHGPEAQAAKEFARALSDESHLAVRLWDERLSTVEAERAMSAGGARRRKQRGVVDKVAAALVLDSYLSAHRSK